LLRIGIIEIYIIEIDRLKKMSRNQYSIANHTILSLIYRVLQPEIQNISIVDYSFYYSLPTERSQNKNIVNAWVKCRSSKHFPEHKETKLIINLTSIRKQTQIHFL
jgi:hypothetical protein